MDRKTWLDTYHLYWNLCQMGFNEMGDDMLRKYRWQKYYPDVLKKL